MQCGYHAWTYDLTGCLKGAPRTAAEPGFRLEDYPLLPLRVETLGPWVFVNADRDAEPLASQFGKSWTSSRKAASTSTPAALFARDWESHANWKTMLENYLDATTAPWRIRASARRSTSGRRTTIWRRMAGSRARSAMYGQSALEGRSQVKIYDVRGEVAQSQYHLLFPNMTININPGFPNLSIDVWMADGPNATQGFSEQYFAPGVTEEFAQELIEFNRQVGAEDDELTNSVQRGLRAGIPEHGRFLTNSEHLVGHFQKLVASVVWTAN